MINKKEANLLKKKLNKWSKQYHQHDSPEVSDVEYDDALRILTKYEEANPNFVTPNSPTQVIGGPISKKFNKFIHKNKMYSLSNAFNNEDLIDFNKRAKKILNIIEDIQYISELKIDGVSISLHYLDGKLIHGVTRGDGIIGENITSNVRVIKDIPNEINYKKELEVRGEIFLYKKEFDKLNKKGSNFSNPRNAVGGTLRQLDSRVVAKRNLSSFFYSVVNLESHKIKTQKEALVFLKKLNFKINNENMLHKNIDSVIKQISIYEDNRKNYDYEIDGVVIKINNSMLYDELGYTSKFPKYMIAFKFKPELVETELLDIFPTVGRTGRITYNAKLKPIKLMGTIISAATLHNADYIRKININIGDIVLIKKAGDIIPKVLSASSKINNIKWKESKNCPVCNSILNKITGEVDQYCINESCPKILHARLIHFTSRGAMNIEGLGSEIILLFINNNLLTSLFSIYELKNHYNKIINLKNFGEKSAKNLLLSIEKSKSQSLSKFVFGLGIRHIGAKLSTIIAKRFNTIEKIMEIKEEDIINIRDIGDVVVNSLVSYFKNNENKNMIRKFISLEVNPNSITKLESTQLLNLSFVITGSLTKPRVFYQSKIELNGGNTMTSISSKTDYLIVGENVGSKLEKAKKLNVKIINETEFLKLIYRDNGDNNE